MWSAVTSGALIGLLFMTGCQATADKKGNTKPPAQTVPQRPPLVVPSEFASNQAKLDFASKAIIDEYYVEAQPLLEQIAQAEPSAGVYSKLGVARYNQNDFAGAIDAWKQASVLDPLQVGEMQNNIGNALRDQKKYDEAKAAYQAAIAANPSLWQSAINLATLHRVNGEVQEGINVLEAAIEKNPEVPRLADLLKVMQMELQKTAQK